MVKLIEENKPRSKPNVIIPLSTGRIERNGWGEHGEGGCKKSCGRDLGDRCIRPGQLLCFTDPTQRSSDGQNTSNRFLCPCPSFLSPQHRRLGREPKLAWCAVGVCTPMPRGKENRFQKTGDSSLAFFSMEDQHWNSMQKELPLSHANRFPVTFKPLHPRNRKWSTLNSRPTSKAISISTVCFVVKTKFSLKKEQYTLSTCEMRKLTKPHQGANP